MEEIDRRELPTQKPKPLVNVIEALYVEA